MNYRYLSQIQPKSLLKWLVPQWDVYTAQSVKNTKVGPKWRLERMRMTKLTIIERVINWFKSLFEDKEEMKAKSDEMKKEMCIKSIRGGACPHDCEICAWNTQK